MEKALELTIIVYMFFSRWVYIYIPLANPTHETLVLQMINTDPRHFAVEADPDQPVSKVSVLSQKR